MSRARGRSGARLEVIDKGRPSPRHPVPLLFVHGAFHSAWCWDEHFLDHFATQGYRAVALSLRGHGASRVARPLMTCSITDYVDDVVDVVAGLGTTPVLVGHSMGGFVVQKYLERRSAPAAVLLASAPPRGHHVTVLRLSASRPLQALHALVTGRPSKMFATAQHVRDSFFTPQTPEPVVEKVFARLEEDSPRAAIADMALLRLVDTASVSTPVLVVGGERDATHPPGQVEATARAYRTEAHILPGAGHDLMLDTGWRQAAVLMAGWLAQRGL